MRWEVSNKPFILKFMIYIQTASSYLTNLTSNSFFKQHSRSSSRESAISGSKYCNIATHCCMNIRWIWAKIMMKYYLLACHCFHWDQEVFKASTSSLLDASKIVMTTAIDMFFGDKTFIVTNFLFLWQVMAWRNTAVTPLLMHWSYCSIAQSQRSDLAIPWW